MKTLCYGAIVWSKDQVRHGIERRLGLISALGVLRCPADAGGTVSQMDTQSR
ncbi:hypothetical protein [Trichothermofontia sp.]